MKRLLILGAGTAGTMAANRLHKALPDDWQITVVDNDPIHVYQPGLLFIPFGTYTRRDVTKQRKKYLAKGINSILGAIDLVEPDQNQVRLVDGTVLKYDQLVIATGTSVQPGETKHLTDDASASLVHQFYTLDGAEALAKTLSDWPGGKLLVHITEMPIKCPVAPLEFSFLADSFFRDKGIRDKVDITYVTPLTGAFTKPVASKYLGEMLSDRQINVETDFYVEHIDSRGAGSGRLVSFDERELEFDLLVTVPINMGAEYIERSGLGDELRHVPVNKHSMLSNAYNNIFAIGDASNLPTSKAGSVAHFAVELLEQNFLQHIQGQPMTHEFDGHANCFIESGGGKASLIDFNYNTEPLPGTYPFPKIGPFHLLGESRLNHQGKLGFRWAYWNLLLPGRNFFISPTMSMSGKTPASELDLEQDSAPQSPDTESEIPVPTF